MGCNKRLSFLVTCALLLIIIFLILTTLLDPTVTNDGKKFRSYNQYEVNTDDFNNVTWIIQVSDLHFSIFDNQSRITEFSHFCNTTLNIIAPQIVLATGDLTNGGPVSKITQYEKEWIYYRNVLRDNNVTTKTIWLDIRGNHDNFNVLNVDAENNYFRKYSVQGSKYPKSYIFNYKTKYNEIISFIAVDACLDVGTRRPFNFIGQINEDELGRITNFTKHAVINSHYIMWFGHYPTSTILLPGASQLRSLIGSTEKSLAYVCGHLHTLEGSLDKMYAPQKDGFFELELSDWMKSRKFRLMAIDHGQFSFTDVQHGHWPLILVTNPKQIMFNPPMRNYKPDIPKLTFIRILVFSPDAITQVQTKIDDGQWITCANVEGPLYVTKWQSIAGIHIMKVVAVDSKGRRMEIDHEFSLDGSVRSTKFYTKLVLMLNWNLMFQVILVISVCLIIIPLSIFRFTERSNIAFMKMNSLWIRKFCILSNINSLYYPLMFYPVYLIIGPWAVGNLLKDHFGVIFVWGMFVNWTYIPASFSFIFAILQAYFIHFLLIFVATRKLDRRLTNIINDQDHRSPRRKTSSSTSDNIYFGLLVTCHVLECISIYFAFGQYTLFFFPMKLLWLVIAAWVWYRIGSMDRAHLAFISQRWNYTYRNAL